MVFAVPIFSEGFGPKGELKSLATLCTDTLRYNQENSGPKEKLLQRFQRRLLHIFTKPDKSAEHKKF